MFRFSLTTTEINPKRFKTNSADFPHYILKKWKSKYILGKKSNIFLYLTYQLDAK